MRREQILAGIVALVAVVTAIIVLIVTQGPSAIAPIIAMGILIGAGLITLAIIASGHRRREFRERVRLDAAELGLNLEPKGENRYWNIATKHAHLRNRRASIYTQMCGLIDGERPIEIFNHVYMVMAGQTPVTVAHRVAMIEAPKDWPMVTIKPRRLPRLRRLWPTKQLELENDAFNYRFVVESEDEGFTIALLTPEAQSWMTERNGKSLWHIENGWLAYLEPGTLQPGDAARLSERICGLMARIPDELRGAAAPHRTAPELSAHDTR